MNYEEMYKAINKGVPNYLTISINIDTLISECASDKALLFSEMLKVREKFDADIIKRMGYTKSQHAFFGELCTRCAYKDSENKMYVNPNKFLTILKHALNVNDESMYFSDDELKRKLMERVEVLKTITTLEELEKEFPVIYGDYLLSIKGYQNILELESDSVNKRDVEAYAKYKKAWKVFNAYGLDSRFKNFMEKQCVAYRNYVVRRTFVESMCFNQPLSFQDFQGLDKEKFELYMADKYLTLAYESDNNEIKQNCIYYVISYIRETKVSDISIKNDRGEEVTFRKLTSRYKKLLKNNENLRSIDEPRSNFKGYNIRHTLNHIALHYGSIVSWSIVPSGELDEDELREDVIKELNRKYAHLTYEEKKQRVLERFGVYERKVNFFERTNYVLKIYGLDKFDGYIAYVYPNGEILLERYFSDKEELVPAVGEAVYNLNIYNFETLSKCNKLELIRSGSVKRIVHGQSFEESAQKVIDRVASEQVISDTKEFVLRFKPKKAIN